MTGTLVNGRRLPDNSTIVMHHGLVHYGHNIITIGADFGSVVGLVSVFVFVVLVVFGSFVCLFVCICLHLWQGR